MSKKSTEVKNFLKIELELELVRKQPSVEYWFNRKVM